MAGSGMVVWYSPGMAGHLHKRNRIWSGRPSRMRPSQDGTGVADDTLCLAAIDSDPARRFPAHTDAPLPIRRTCPQRRAGFPIVWFFRPLWGLGELGGFGRAVRRTDSAIKNLSRTTKGNHKRCGEDGGGSRRGMLLF